MAIEMGKIVRAHLSGVQAIDNARISNARKVAKACMDENQRNMRKVYNDHLARFEAAEYARVAKVRMAEEHHAVGPPLKKYQNFCSQCSKVHPSTKHEPDSTD